MLLINDRYVNNVDIFIIGQEGVGTICILFRCDIETYLLEKARITFQQEVERSYHIFYQMMQPAVAELKKKCLLSNDIYDYHYVSQVNTAL